MQCVRRVLVKNTNESSVEESTEELPEVHGNAAMQQRLSSLIRRHRKAFSRLVNMDPASVAPMEVRLTDTTTWEQGSNARAPRSQSPMKLKALREQIDTMLLIGVISESQATHFSQVLMVAKPHQPGEWRMCVDYRTLNELSEG